MSLFYGFGEMALFQNKFFMNRFVFRECTIKNTYKNDPNVSLIYVYRFIEVLRNNLFRYWFMI